MASSHYWAIPLQSRLYARLQEDYVFCTLMEYLFPYGCGIYRFFEIDPEEVEETVEDLVQFHAAALGPETEARRRIAEFRAELERTCADFPGIENRHGMLEKRIQEFKERLIREFNRVRPDGAELADKVLFGDGSLAPRLRRPENDLGLMSPPVVREGAGILERLRREELFAPDEGWEWWLRENYEPWRRLYLEAAERAEALIVGAS
jgi:hypothetical protein